MLRHVDAPVPRAAEYPLFGQGTRGGPYNSHLVSAAVFVVLTACGWVSAWLTAWIVGCLAAAMFLDHGRGRKVVWSAIPSQTMLYGQVLARAAWDALPWYVFALAIYICVAPLWEWTNLAISSFVMVYGFYMAMRLWWLGRYLWLLSFRWESAGRTFAVHRANLKSRHSAIRHVLWSYFLGNVGLVIRCASQVLTISLFEWLRRLALADFAPPPALSEYITPLRLTVAGVWLAALWPAMRQNMLIYYRTHRTFHHCGALYDSIHAIHHRGVLPTPLDSGTISPAEFLITEMAFPAGTLVPNWWWTGAQCILGFAGHWPSHDAGSRIKVSQHHLQHHRHFSVNFGLTPAEDSRFGTLYTSAEPTEPAGDDCPSVRTFATASTP